MRGVAKQCGRSRRAVSPELKRSPVDIAVRRDAGRFPTSQNGSKSTAAADAVAATESRII